MAVGIPQLLIPFLQWLGLILIQIVGAVFVVEFFAYNYDLSRLKGYLVSAILIVVLTVAARFL